MRVLFSFAPAVVLVLAIGILYRYPLTRERMQEIKAELEARRKLTAT
jgi:Na+/melibiose symporter-like transporter